MGDRILIVENRIMIPKDAVCKHPEAGACEHRNDLYACTSLGDILATRVTVSSQRKHFLPLDC